MSNNFNLNKFLQNADNDSLDSNPHMKYEQEFHFQFHKQENVNLMQWIQSHLYQMKPLKLL